MAILLFVMIGFVTRATRHVTCDYLRLLQNKQGAYLQGVSYNYENREQGVHFQMTLNIAIPKIRKATLTMMALIALLAACAPAEVTTSEPSPASTITAAPTSTATPLPTPTVTLDPEEAAEAAQAAIRAEVLSYGIDLDNLAHSDNEYISNHPSVELWQEQLNHSFDNTEVDSETMVVLDVEQLHSEAERLIRPAIIYGLRLICHFMPTMKAQK